LNVCETWSVNLTKDARLRVIVNKELGRGGGGKIPRPERSADADNCVMRGFLICTIHYFKGHVFSEACSTHIRDLEILPIGSFTRKN